MNNKLAISKYVAIRNGQLLVNGTAVLKGDTSLPVKELFKGWYTELGIEYPKFFKMDMLCKL